MLTKPQRSQLRNLLASNEYKTLLALRDNMIVNWNNHIPIGDSEFEYLRSAFERDGKMKGLKSFFDEIEQLANKE